ncbi:restriction endonuclease subunit S [Acinetobacter sp. NIPH 1852]|uniref:restriction endonuclease subunit S n=1 Tax=Acinetobacter sp. NIPH 1852 TaxID=2923428 RepID=UPI001F4BA06A|nr:restriction endonuclease subunit S [Acinetobacter sp. NIPH 1852]MCH7309573.1 restriction endonuclease subunit S [Acinetobacter sp. NIPH 1852]
MKLGNILSVKVGVAQFETTDEGVNNLTQVGLVNGANISELGDLDFVDAELKYVYVSAEKLHDNALKAGDIILMSRGSNMRAAIVNQQDIDKDLIASPNCLVLTANLNYVLPEVIVAFLNSELGQKTLDSLSTGATIKNVPARKIKDIDLRVPDLAVQNKIAQIFKQNIETLKSLKVLQMQQKITANAAIQKLMAE